MTLKMSSTYIHIFKPHLIYISLVPGVMSPLIWTTLKDSTSWCGLSSSRVIVSDEVLTQKHRSYLEILGQYVWKENDHRDIESWVYNDEEERASTISYSVIWRTTLKLGKIPSLRWCLRSRKRIYIRVSSL